MTTDEASTLLSWIIGSFPILVALAIWFLARDRI